MPEALIEIDTEDGCIDAIVAAPDRPDRRPPVILLADRSEAADLAGWLAGQGYFVLAPDWRRRAFEDRRADADAWLDWLADQRCVDDLRIGVVGLQGGANLALRLAAWRAERIAAVMAVSPRGFGPGTAQEIAASVNGLVLLCWPRGATSRRGLILASALSAAGVDFEVGIAGDEPLEDALLELLERTLRPLLREPVAAGGVQLSPHNP